MVSIRWPHCIIREQLPVNTFFKDIVIVPELFHFFFSLNEVQIGVNLFVHEDQSFLIL